MALEGPRPSNAPLDGKEGKQPGPKPAVRGGAGAFTGWSSSTDEADWALRPLLYGPSAPPRLYNIAYYDNPKVNEGIEKALIVIDHDEKAKIYKEVQEQIWEDAPWAFLTTGQLLYARNKKLTGAYIMPDASYFFEAMELSD